MLLVDELVERSLKNETMVLLQKVRCRDTATSIKGCMYHYIHEYLSNYAQIRLYPIYWIQPVHNTETMANL